MLAGCRTVLSDCQVRRERVETARSTSRGTKNVVDSSQTHSPSRRHREGRIGDFLSTCWQNGRSGYTKVGFQLRLSNCVPWYWKDDLGSST